MANMGKQHVSSRQGTNLGQRKSIFERSKFPQPSSNISPSPETTDLSGYRQSQPGEMMANVMDSLSTSKSASPPNYITGQQLPVQKRQEREVNMASVNQLKAPPRQSNLSEKPVQKQEESIPNQTGLPDNLKAGVENLSGYSLDDVRVHYNSPKPAQLQAHAYTQGTDIHVAPGQEKHLPHEAWHVVQQMQGRVKPTVQMKEVQINDDEGLEREADDMGSKAVQLSVHTSDSLHNCQINASVSSKKTQAEGKIVQADVGFEFEIEPTVKTYRSGLLYGYRSLPKTTRIFNGNDFYIEADGLPGGESSWEFVTTNFPETQPGLMRLLNVLTDIDGIVTLMRNSPLNQYNLVDNTFNFFGNPVADRYFTIAQQNFRTKPQVTAGFSLTALDRLFQSAGTAGGSNLMRHANSMDFLGKTPAGNQIDAPLGNMRNAAHNAINAQFPGQPVNLSLRALVTQLMQIIIEGNQNIGATPKTMMRLVLGRTDMKAAFASLPPLVKVPLENNPANFVNIVMTAVNNHLGMVLNNHTPVISGNLFTHNQYVGDARHNMPSPFTQVTRDQWLTQIANPGGQDLLSKGNYPVRTNWLGWENRTDRQANQLLDSMGGLHGQLDPGNRPIFEIRSSQQISAALISSYALDFFKYVRYLHNPWLLTESTEMSGMAANDVADIVGFSPNRAFLLWQQQQRAITNFNN